MELVAGAAPSNVEVAENSGPKFFVTDASHGGTVLTVRIQNDGSNQADSPANVTYLLASENSRSWSTQVTFHGVSQESHKFTVGQIRKPITIEKLDIGRGCGADRPGAGRQVIPVVPLESSSGCRRSSLSRDLVSG